MDRNTVHLPPAEAGGGRSSLVQGVVGEGDHEVDPPHSGAAATAQGLRRPLRTSKHFWHQPGDRRGHQYLGGRWVRGGNSPTAGDMCWALAVLGPAGLRSGGRTKPPQLRHILPAWGAMRGHPCLLAVIRDTSWGLVTGASIASGGSGLGWEVGGCVPPLPCFPELEDAMLSPTKPGFVSGPTLGSP